MPAGIGKALVPAGAIGIKAHAYLLEPADSPLIQPKHAVLPALSLEVGLEFIPCTEIRATVVT